MSPVRVLVGASASSDAHEFVLTAQQLGTAAHRLAASAAALADGHNWSGATADRFRQDHQAMSGVLDRMVHSVQRMAQGAQSVIDSIDAEDAKGAATLPAALAAGGGQASSGPAIGSAVGSYAGSGNVGPSLPKGTVITKDGAFQPDINTKDYNSLGALDKLKWIPFYEEARMVQVGMVAVFGPNSSNFFGHYLDNSGKDLHFNSVHPYQESMNFAKLVDGTAAAQISQAQASGVKTFDSGWIYDAVPDKSGKAISPFTDNQDWKNAIGKGYYRLTGYQAADGTWHTNLQMTSYYDFHHTQNFVANLTGDNLHALHQAGLARNFREIGSGALQYDGNGNPLPKPNPAPGPPPTPPSPGPNPLATPSPRP